MYKKERTTNLVVDIRKGIGRPVVALEIVLVAAVLAASFDIVASSIDNIAVGYGTKQ